MLKKWAFFYYSSGHNPETNTTRNVSGEVEFITVGFDPGINKTEEIKQVANQLVSEGVQMIELCGGFGPEMVASLSEFLDYKIPIGGVFYGPKFRKLLYEINSKN